MFRILHFTEETARHRSFLASLGAAGNRYWGTQPINHASSEAEVSLMLAKAAQQELPVSLLLLDSQKLSVDHSRQLLERMLAADTRLQVILLHPEASVIGDALKDPFFTASKQIMLLAGDVEHPNLRSTIQMLATRWENLCSAVQGRRDLSHALNFQTTQLRLAEREFQAKLGTFHKAFQQSLVPHAYVDRDSLAWLDHNDAFARLLGKNSGLPAWTDLIADTTVADQLKMPAPALLHYPVVLTTPRNGTKKQVYLSALATTFQEREALLLTFENVTERVELAEMTKLASRLQEMEENQSGLYHEFNNLMTVAIGQLDSLMADAEVSLPVRAVLTEVQAAQQASVKAAQKWLGILPAAPVEEVQLVDFGKDVIGRIVDAVGPVLGETTVLESDFQVRVEPGSLDEPLLEELILHLAHTSRDAMPNGGKVKFGIRAWQGRTGRYGQFLQITFADTGSAGGDPREDALRIGLEFPSHCPAVAKRLLQAQRCAGRLGGWLECESKPSGATVVQVYVPAGQPASLQGQRIRLKPMPQADPKERTVMVVEDHGSIRLLLVQILSNYGFRVLAAGSADEATRLWTDHAAKIQALFTDVSMPGEVTGLQLAKKFLESQPELKVVVCSGYTSAHLRATEEDMHFEYLAKPYERETVRKMLATLFPTLVLGGTRRDAKEPQEAEIVLV